MAVIGCGNLARSDDAAGVEVVHRLRDRLGQDSDQLKLIDAGTAGMEVMFATRGADRVIIVDACRSGRGGEPGAVFRVPGSELQTPMQQSFTLHGLRWDHALYAGSRMFGADFARDTEVFLIEVQSIDFGIGLSEPVKRGVERVIDEIEQMVRSHVGAV
jgi:hydrogenase maturation protease